MNLAMIFIAHDLSVVRHLCQNLAVMYLGRIVEMGPTEEIFRSPRHPYTRGLIDAIPKMTPEPDGLETSILGEPPSPIRIPEGCAFHPRCAHAMEACRAGPPPSPRPAGPVRVWCHLYGDGEAPDTAPGTGGTVPG